MAEGFHLRAVLLEPFEGAEMRFHGLLEGEVGGVGEGLVVVRAEVGGEDLCDGGVEVEEMGCCADYVGAC